MILYDILTVYLENGLRVVMHRIPRIKTVACGIWVGQGSKHEDDNNNGLSHLIEHLMIQTDNEKNQEFNALINDITSEGVMYNAATTKESTCFYFTGLADNLEKCIKTLSSIVINNQSFPEKLMENEKKVVVQEAVSFYSSFNQIKERTSQALWGHIGIGKMIVGSIDNIKNAKMENIEEIISGSYTPENSVLVVVGDMDYQDSLKIIEDNFEKWQDRCTRDYTEIIQSDPGIYYNQGNGGKNTVVSIGFRTPGYMQKERIYIDVMSKILGDTSLSSRLVQGIRVKRGLAYNLGTFANFYENRGTFAFTAVCAKESVEEVVRIAVEEFNKAKACGFSLSESEKSKRILKTNRLLEVGDLASQLKFLGKCASYGHLYSLEQELRNIEKVELDTLNKVAKEIINQDSISLAVIGECDIDNLIALLNIQ